MNISALNKKRIAGCAVFFVLLVLLVMAAVAYWPTSRNRMCHSVAVMECRSYYTVHVGGKPLFCFRGLTADTLFDQVDTAAVEASSVTYSPACWAIGSTWVSSCKGRLITHVLAKGDSVRSLASKLAQHIVERQTEELQKEEKALKHKASELKYYLTVHSVQDEGFNAVSKYAVKVNHEKDSVTHLLERLRHISQHARLTVSYTTDFTLLTRNVKGKLQRIPCRQLSVCDGNGFVMVQTQDKATPDDATPQHFHKWLAWSGKADDLVFVPGFAGMGSAGFDVRTATARITPGHMLTDSRHNIPSLLAPDGSPVFSHQGCFLGLTCQGRVVSPRQIKTLFEMEK